jgi:hypothetical protein
MALTSSQQSSRLFKKSLGAAETLTTKEFFSEPKLGKYSIFTSQIWTDSDKIPTAAPTLSNGATSGVVQYFSKLALTVIPGSTNLSYYHDSLKNTIPFNFGDGSYNYTLYKSDGTTQIPFGSPGGDWLLDTEAGVLTWYGTLPTGVSDTNPPQISFYKYVGAIGLSSTNSTSGLNPHPSVKYATTSGDTLINYSNTTSGFTTLPTAIDGITSFSNGDRILVKNQVNGIQNGIFVVSGTTLVRADDTNGNPFGEVSINDYCFVLSGNTLYGTGWVLYSSDSTDVDNRINVGINTQLWTLFETSKTFYADNNALKLNGNEFYIQLNSGASVTYGSGLYQSIDGLRLSDTVLSTIATVTNLNFSNGVTLSGNSVTLGGTLISATTINGNNSNDLNLINLNKFNVTTNSGLNFYNKLDKISIDLGYTKSGVTTISGNTNYYRGLEYAYDFSNNYSNRSLVDKAYVDASILASGITSSSAGSGLTFNTSNKSLNVNVDNYTVKIVNNEIRGSQMWIQTDKLTTISSGTTGQTNITLTYDPITPVQIFINGIEYLVNVGATNAITDKPFYFNTLLPTVGSRLYFDASIAGFDLVSGTDLITCQYQYISLT